MKRWAAALPYVGQRGCANQNSRRLDWESIKKKQIWNENIILVRGYLYPVCTVYAYATVDGDASGFFRSLAGTDDDEVQI